MTSVVKKADMGTTAYFQITRHVATAQRLTRANFLAKIRAPHSTGTVPAYQFRWG
jgi:hypothetical protein